jgi:aldehyde dehydrogenase
MSAVNETLIRDVVSEVLGRLNGSVISTKPAASPTPAKTDCGCGEKNRVSGGSIAVSRGGNKYGVFQDANEACAAAHEGFLQLREKGVAARAKVVEIVKAMAEANAEAWGKIELDETKIGRLDHKIEKLKIIKLVPGVEWLNPYARSGDHGITLEEYTPFGVVAAITPSTHSIPTLSGNIVNIVAAGNGVVFNAHPGAAKCAALAVREYNKAIERETGIQNLITIIEQPTLDSFNAICRRCACCV